MDTKKNISVRQQFGEYLKRHREEVLKVKSVRQLSFSSNLDSSKLSKIEKGLINMEFDTLVEIALTYRLEKKKLFGFVIDSPEQ